jgi:hypothetical protein
MRPGDLSRRGSGRHWRLGRGLRFLRIGLVAGSVCLATGTASSRAVSDEVLLRDLAAAAGDAHHLAAQLAEEVPAERFAQLLAENPTLAAPALATLAEVIADRNGEPAQRLGGYLSAVARARSRALAAHAPWTDADLGSFLRLAVVEPSRFVSDEAFRQHILARLDGVLEPTAPRLLREETLTALDNLPGIDFGVSERLALAWDLALRVSTSRQADYSRVAPLRFGADDAPIAASLYSLPSSFFQPAAAERFLSAVRAAAPHRRLLVLADLPIRHALADRAAALGIDLLDTWGNHFSPWPRDPLSMTRSADHRLVILERPNLQHGREADRDMGRAIVDGLPVALDQRWGKSGGGRWTTAPIPFHNGQLLLRDDALWISLHSLEPRILTLLGLEKVPVASFAETAGVRRYLDAAKVAADELGRLTGRPVRFVHTLPRLVDAATDHALLGRIGGGAGYDLDSLLTLLPGSGQGTALVASVTAGGDLAAHSSLAELDGLASAYGLNRSGEPLREALVAAQHSARALALEGFLDLVATDLAREGFAVRRLPLLFVPTTLLPGSLTYPEFLLGWNNVVIEHRDGMLRAEGFAGLFVPGDVAAGLAFAAAGSHLDLFPPLIASVIANGGYRCASNQLREEDDAALRKAGGTARRR